MTNEITKKTKKERPSGSKLATVFIGAVGISAAVYFLIYLVLGNGRFTDIFFTGGRDFFMDCFNSIRDAAQGSGVYSERGVIYPPMANLIFLILSRFTPAAYNSTSFEERYTWTNYIPCIILVLIVVSACAILIFALTEKASSEPSQTKKMMLAATVVLSVPMLYLVERGNMLVLCIAALMIYFITYDSKSRWKRELGLIALAFAFSLKLYPVVFGWLLIVNKRYREAVRCAIYGVLMIILPSFFFGGPIFCAKHLVGNIFNFSTGTGNDVGKIMDYLGVNSTLQGAANALIYLWVLICAACFVISSLTQRENVQRLWILGVATILCVPSLTGIYNWAFLTVPLIMIFNKKELDRRDIAYFALIALPYLFLPFRINLHANPSDIAVYVMTAALSVFAVADTVMDTVKLLQKKTA